MAAAAAARGKEFNTRYVPFVDSAGENLGREIQSKNRVPELFLYSYGEHDFRGQSRVVSGFIYYLFTTVYAHAVMRCYEQNNCRNPSCPAIAIRFNKHSLNISRRVG